jgi:hypothetical protein
VGRHVNDILKVDAGVSVQNYQQQLFRRRKTNDPGKSYPPMSFIYYHNWSEQRMAYERNDERTPFSKILGHNFDRRESSPEESTDMHIKVPSTG